MLLIFSDLSENDSKLLIRDDKIINLTKPIKTGDSLLIKINEQIFYKKMINKEN